MGVGLRALLRGDARSVRKGMIYFTKEHEWALVEGNVAVIGITDHAQHSLGDVVYLEFA